MEFATGALGTLLPKLANLLQGEYKLHKNVRKNVEFVTKELEHTQAALRSVGNVPPEQLPELVKLWTRDARELSYHMEDVIDTFLVRVQGPNPPNRKSSKMFIQKMRSMLAMVKRHQIGEQIMDIKERVTELAARRDRYKVHTINPMTTLDPRIGNIYAKATDLVGINKAKEELVMKLTKGDEMSMQKQMIVSIVGFGGLGKTTLAKAVFDEIQSQFDCTAFVTVSQNPDMKKILKDILHELGHVVYGSLDERQLIDVARRFLHDKRYFIVIDDIWNASHWDMIIKHALPDDNTGCRIIATTRIVTVANHIGHAYEMQPLSRDDSRALLYKRIFYFEDPEKCLDENLVEVSDRILKKCAGVPLAIITIASLLASKGINKTEWEEVHNSIGNGMENSLDAENMRKILSYSYYDLSSNLRTCLLYLSMFPEDSKIEKDHLIWLWIGEGFIQQEKQRKRSKFEIGESYFNELINRSMIQPMYNLVTIEIESCHVHDMVLDLICSISNEENFVTKLSNMDQISPSTMVRRLSLQNSKTDCDLTRVSRSMLLVRSIVLFPSAFGQMIDLPSFKFLRLLDVDGCHHLHKPIIYRCLFHLRYLRLTRIDHLPEEVGNLQFLEILDIVRTGIHQLPKSFAQLTHLLCLSVCAHTRVPNGIKSLTSLEQLTVLRIDDESLDNIDGLGLLTELRVLRIMLHTDKLIDKLMDSIRKLRKIQILSIDLHFMDHLNRNIGGLDAWVPPPQLRSLHTADALWFSALPAWMNNPLQFQVLTDLIIAVRGLQQEDLVILGRLPSLGSLNLEVNHKDLGSVGKRFVIVAGLFQCLVVCGLWGFLWPVVFQEGAMPRLRKLSFDFDVPKAMEFPGRDGDFKLNLGNLLSLEIVSVWVEPGDASKVEVQEARAAVTHAAEIHPNRPELVLRLSDDEGSDTEESDTEESDVEES